MIKPRPLLPLLCASLFAAAFVAPVMAQTTTTDDQVEADASVPADRLVSTYTDLAGSAKNAQSLIDGLRNGTEITLDGSSFTPSSGKMGWGEINIALSLAQALVGTDATGTELQAALNGGTITNADGTTTTLDGVLRMRADGMGWGQIAKQLGFKLGALVSASHTDKSQAGSHTASAKADTARADKPIRAEHADRPERPTRAERADRPERPSRPERRGG